MGAFIDIKGIRYGRLIPIEYVGLKTGRTSWLCQCDCGNTFVVTANSLRTGKTKSCGCIRNERKIKREHKVPHRFGEHLIKHGKHNTRLYPIWKSMRQRCNNPHDRYYADYGGRGITVTPEWDDFQKFYDWAMANGYDPDAPFSKCTIDRIDNNKGYSPDNCRWVSMLEQVHNQRPRKNRKKEVNHAEYQQG